MPTGSITLTSGSRLDHHLHSRYILQSILIVLLPMDRSLQTHELIIPLCSLSFSLTRDWTRIHNNIAPLACVWSCDHWIVLLTSQESCSFQPIRLRANSHSPFIAINLNNSLSTVQRSDYAYRALLQWLSISISSWCGYQCANTRSQD